MLAAALRRHGGDRAFDELQQRLLHALARDIAGDRGVVGLARDLVDLVDVDDAGLRLLDVVIALLQQLLDDVLDVLAHVAGFGEGRRVRDGEGHVQEPRERLGEQRLAAAGGADEQDVALGNLDLLLGGARGVAGTGLQALVVVVDRDREHFLGALLADDVFVEDFLDLVGLRELVARALGAVLELLPDDVVAELDAFVADEHRGTCDQLTDLVLALPAEGAVQEFAVVVTAAGGFAHRGSFQNSIPLLLEGGGARVSYSTVSGHEAKRGRTAKYFCVRELYDVVHLFYIIRPTCPARAGPPRAPLPGPAQGSGGRGADQPGFPG